MKVEVNKFFLSVKSVIFISGSIRLLLAMAARRAPLSSNETVWRLACVLWIALRGYVVSFLNNWTS